MEEKLNSISNLFDFTLDLQTPKANTEWVRDKTTNKEEEKIVSYTVRGEINVFYNDNTLLYNSILINTLNALCLPDNEIKDYEEKGIPYYSFKTPYQENEATSSGRNYVSPWTINLRNKIKKDYGLRRKIENSMVISDNISSPTKLTIEIPYSGEKPLRASYYWQIKEKLLSGKKNRKLIKYSKPGDKITTFDIEITIPQEDIGKYSKFTIESK